MHLRGEGYLALHRKDSSELGISTCIFFEHIYSQQKKKQKKKKFCLISF
jgi:hypothetical protein